MHGNGRSRDLLRPLQNPPCLVIHSIIDPFFAIGFYFAHSHTPLNTPELNLFIHGTLDFHLSKIQADHGFDHSSFLHRRSWGFSWRLVGAPPRAIRSWNDTAYQPCQTLPVNRKTITSSDPRSCFWFQFTRTSLTRPTRIPHSPPRSIYWRAVPYF
ncbi:hypothetical protein BDR07DRAFT_242289 [Suillus spraguei]|nr:hypothetical protein BDR07DRAFT_242289 [Suillus spraguei]